MSVQTSTTRLDFRQTQSGVYATIETNHLLLRPIEKADVDNCLALYSNPEVMEKYLDGTTKDLTYTAARVNTLTKRWQDGDPFSGFSVFLKDGHGHETFAGLAVLGHGDRPGEAALAGLGDKQFWNTGYGTEAANAIVHVFAPRLAADRFPVGATKTEAGQPLRKIVATARIDNLGSTKLLETIGMRNIGTELNNGALRNKYEYELPQKSRGWCTLL